MSNKKEAERILQERYPSNDIYLDPIPFLQDLLSWSWYNVMVNSKTVGVVTIGPSSDRIFSDITYIFRAIEKNIVVI